MLRGADLRTALLLSLVVLCDCSKHQPSPSSPAAGGVAPLKFPPARFAHAVETHTAVMPLQHTLADCSTTPVCAVLPAAWTKYFDEETGCDYYWNSNTLESTWDSPPCRTPPRAPPWPPSATPTPSPVMGCDGIASSGLVVDVCGECGGTGTSCVGCDGVPHSGVVSDECGVCGGHGEPCLVSPTPPATQGWMPTTAMTTTTPPAPTQPTSAAPPAHTTTPTPTSSASPERSTTPTPALPSTPAPLTLKTEPRQPFIMVAVQLQGLNFYKFRLDQAQQRVVFAALFSAIQTAALDPRFPALLSHLPCSHGLPRHCGSSLPLDPRPLTTPHRQLTLSKPLHLDRPSTNANPQLTATAAYKRAQHPQRDPPSLGLVCGPRCDLPALA
jgi:hypothetical protein